MRERVLTLNVQSYRVIHCIVNYESVCHGWRHAGVGVKEGAYNEADIMQQKLQLMMMYLCVCFIVWVYVSVFVRRKRRRLRWRTTMGW